jgi:hypothetical protein
VSLDDMTRKAGVLADAVGRYTLAAAVAESREDKRAHLVRAFTSYACLARSMSLLEQAAPNCAREGFDEAAKIHDVIEGRAA